MGLLNRLKAWTTLPVVDPTVFRCRDCSAVLDEAGPACPECGGDIEEIVHDPIDLYWPHH